MMPHSDEDRTRYVLMLNDMREPNIENLRAVKVGTRAELVAFYEAHVEPWMDGQWGKTFRQGSPLEWFNAGDVDTLGAYWGGIYGPVPDGMTDEHALQARLSKC